MYHYYKCRLCLEESNQTVDIFKHGFSKMIQLLTGLTVDCNDSFPNTACIQCYKEVKAAMLTRYQIIYSHKTLLDDLLLNKNEFTNDLTHLKINQVKIEIPTMINGHNEVHTISNYDKSEITDFETIIVGGTTTAMSETNKYNIPEDLPNDEYEIVSDLNTRPSEKSSLKNKCVRYANSSDDFCNDCVNDIQNSTDDNDDELIANSEHIIHAARTNPSKDEERTFKKLIQKLQSKEGRSGKPFKQNNKYGYTKKVIKGKFKVYTTEQRNNKPTIDNSSCMKQVPKNINKCETSDFDTVLAKSVVTEFGNTNYGSGHENLSSDQYDAVTDLNVKLSESLSVPGKIEEGDDDELSESSSPSDKDIRNSIYNTSNDFVNEDTKDSVTSTYYDSDDDSLIANAEHIIQAAKINPSKNEERAFKRLIRKLQGKEGRSLQPFNTTKRNSYTNNKTSEIDTTEAINDTSLINDINEVSLEVSNTSTNCISEIFYFDTVLEESDMTEVSTTNDYNLYINSSNKCDNVVDSNAEFSGMSTLRSTPTVPDMIHSEDKNDGHRSDSLCSFEIEDDLSSTDDDNLIANSEQIIHAVKTDPSKDKERAFKKLIRKLQSTKGRGGKPFKGNNNDSYINRRKTHQVKCKPIADLQKTYPQGNINLLEYRKKERDKEKEEDNIYQVKINYDLKPEHIEFLKTIKGKASATCPICFKKSSTRKMKIHLLSHSNDPISCHFCGKAVKNSKKLRDHINYNHKAKPNSFICEQCGKGFRMTGLLENHKKTAHQGPREKLLECHICGKKFLEKSK